MSTRELLKRLLAGALTAVMVMSTAMITEPLPAYAANKTPITYSNRETAPESPEASPLLRTSVPADPDDGDLIEDYSDDDVTVAGEADDTSTDPAYDDSADPEDDLVFVEDIEDTLEYIPDDDILEDELIAEDDVLPEGTDPDDTLEAAEYSDESPIDIYVLDGEYASLTGVFALYGDAEYTWDYADSTDKVLVRIPENEETYDDEFTALDILVECGYTFESPLVINDTEYEIPEWFFAQDEDSFRDYISSIVVVDGIPYSAFTAYVSDDAEELDTEPEDEESYETYPAYSVGVRVRPVTEEESLVSIFRWSDDPADAGKDYYIKDASLELLSITAPIEIDDGATFDLTDEYFDPEYDLPDYLIYQYADDVTNSGILIMPKHTTIEMKILPKHGYQITEFGLDETSVTTGPEDDDAEAGLYVFTADTTLFNPAPVLSSTEDTVITDGAEDVISGEIYINASEDEINETLPGSARLEVTDVPKDGEGSLTPEQIEAFEQAANGESQDITDDASGAQIIDYFDISLINVVYKAEGQGPDDLYEDDTYAASEDDTDEPEAWETEIKNSETSVTVTLNLSLDPEISTEDIQVLHQKEILTGDEVTYEYEVVPSEYDAEELTLTFEAVGSSVYALGVHPLRNAPAYKLEQLDDSNVFVSIRTFDDWTAASAAVAALNDADATYRLTINQVLNDNEPQLITFPKKAKKIIFKGASQSSPYNTLKYPSSVKLPCDVTFEDLYMYIADKTSKQLSPYTVATIDIAGHSLDFAGKQVIFHSPVVFNDSAKKGTFCIGANTKVVTAYTSGYQDDNFDCVSINDLVCKAMESSGEKLKEYTVDERSNFALEDQNVSVLAGSITNVGEVKVPNGNVLVMCDYQSKKDTWVSPTLTASRLDDYGGLWMVTENSGQGKSKAVITSAYMYGSTTVNNELKSDSVTITNLYLMDNGWVESRGAFDITNLTSFTPDATLGTVQNESNKSAPNTPFLNVKGNVILQEPDDRIAVCVKYGSVGWVACLSHEVETPSGDMALLTTKNGTTDQFVPYHNITEDGDGDSNIPWWCWGYDEDAEKLLTDRAASALSPKNESGYFLRKNGSVIHLYTGIDATIAVVKGDYFYGNTTQTAWEVAYAAGADINYYPSWADAVAAVNAAKSKDIYEFIVLDDIGSSSNPNYKPISLTFPAAANISKLYVTGNSPHMGYHILYTNALTLTSDTTFNNISLAPVAYYKQGSKVTFPSYNGAPQKITVAADSYVNVSQPINTGAYDLTFGNVNQEIVTAWLAIHENDIGKTYLDNTFNTRTYVPWIGNITGNGKKKLVLGITSSGPQDHDRPVINGSISKYETVQTPSSYLYVAGDINVNKFYAGNLNMKGQTLKATYIDVGSINAENTNVVATESGIDISSSDTVSRIGSLTAGSTRLTYQLYVKNKTNVKTLRLDKSSQFWAYDDVVISDILTMMGGAELRADNDLCKVKIGDIISNDTDNLGYNTIRYRPTSKNVTSLDITGDMMGWSKVRLYYNVTGHAIDDLLPVETELQQGFPKLTFPAIGNFANVGNNFTGYFILSYNGKDESYPYTYVKYNKGIYLMNLNLSDFHPKKLSTAAKSAVVELTTGGSFVSFYPDLSQAVTEINNINNPNANYKILLSIREQNDQTYYDTVITDNDCIGKLTLPANNRMRSLEIRTWNDNDECNLVYYGNVTGYNSIKFTNINLENVAGANSTATGKGKHVFDELDIESTRMILDGEVKVNKLTAAVSAIILSSKATITELSLSETNAVFYSTADITDLHTDNLSPENGGEGELINSTLMVGVKSPTGPPQLTIRGDVDSPVYISLGAKVNGFFEDFSKIDGGYSYAGKQLVLAPVADASNFYAYGLFVDGFGKIKKNPQYVSYKDGSKYVVNDNLDHMLIRVDNEDHNTVFTYARTWNDAVTAINNANQGDTTYRIEFLKEGNWRANAVVNKDAITNPKTQVAGSYESYTASLDGSVAAYTTSDVAALTMPKATAASCIIISGPTDDATLVYKGAFAPATDVKLDHDISLTNTFTEKYDGKNYYVPDKDGVPTTALTIAAGKTIWYTDDNEEEHGFTNITGTKGTIIMPKNTSGGVSGNINVGKIMIHDGSGVDVTGKVTAGYCYFEYYAELRAGGDVAITDLYMEAKSDLAMSGAAPEKAGKLSIDTIFMGSQGTNEACTIYGGRSTTLNNIIAVNDETELNIEYYITTPTSKAAGVSTLTISGAIYDAEVVLKPQIQPYDTVNGRYKTYDDNSPYYTVVDGDTLKQKFNVYSGYGGYAGKTILGTSKTWNSEMGWYNRKLATLPKAGSEDNITVYNHTSQTYLFKSGSDLYMSDQLHPTVHVYGYTDTSKAVQTYEGKFFDYAEAVSEINRIGSKKSGEPNSYVTVDLSADVGSRAAPVALTIPTNVNNLLLDGGNRTYYTTATKLTTGLNTTAIEYMTIIPIAKGETTQLSINTGKNTLVLDSFGTQDGNKVVIKDITCGSMTVTGNTVRTTGALTATDLTVTDGSGVSVGTMLTADNLNMDGESTAEAANITVKKEAELSSQSILRAGRAFEGDGKTKPGKATDGKITLNDVTVQDKGAVISVKKAALDSKGNSTGSQLTINGKVYYDQLIGADENKHEPIEIEVRENTAGGELKPDGSTKFTTVATPTDGMLLVKAPLASDRFFRVSDSMMNNSNFTDNALKSNGMIHKSGNNIVFETKTAKVRLYPAETILTPTGPNAKTAKDINGDGIIDSDDREHVVFERYIEFDSYEDAVNQINTFNRFKMLNDNGVLRPSQYYDDYAIEFMDNSCDIMNTAGAYTALPLPAKAGELKLYATHGNTVNIRFLGGVTLKSHLVLADGVTLIPVVKSGTNYVETVSAVNLGSYRLRMNADKEVYSTKYEPLRASGITGSKNSRMELLTQNGGKLAVNCTGNLSVPTVRLNPKGDGSCYTDLKTGGNMTITDLDIYSTVSSDAEIDIGGAGVFTNINIDGKVTPYIDIRHAKPIKVNGTVTRSSGAEKIRLKMISSKESLGTVFATGPKLDASDWDLRVGIYSHQNDPYPGYVNGNNLLLGY